MTLCYCWLGQVPDSREPNSTQESGTKVLMVYDWYPTAASL